MRSCRFGLNPLNVILLVWRHLLGREYRPKSRAIQSADISIEEACRVDIIRDYKMEEGFQKADSHNLPTVDVVMVSDFLTTCTNLSQPQTSGAKASR